MKKLILLYIGLAFHLLLQAQPEEILFNKIGVVDGLSNGQINGICKDTSGYMWFASSDGLNRYNGENIKVFRPNFSDSTSLQESIINTIFTDSQGDLWAIGTIIYKYSPKTETFINFHFKLPLNTYHFFEVEPKKFLFTNIGNTTIKLFDGMTGEFKECKELTSFLPDNTEIKTLYIDSYKNIWICTYQNNIIYKLNYTDYKQTKDISVKEYQHSTSAIAFYQKEDKLYFACPHDGLYYYDYKYDSIVKIPTINNLMEHAYSLDLNNILVDYRNSIWFSSGANLFMYNQLTKDFQQFQRNRNTPINEFPISSSTILTMYEDSTHTLWFGTRGGVSYISTYRNNIEHSINLKNKLYHNVEEEINSLFIDSRDNLWIGTPNALNRINFNNQKCDIYKYDPKYEHILLTNSALCINEYKDLIMLGGIGLNICDFDHNIYRYMHPDEKDSTSLNQWVVWKIHKGQCSGDYWIGTFDGVSYLPAKELDKLSFTQPGMKRIYPKFTQYKRNLKNKNSLVGNIIWDLYEDKDGFLWIGTDLGLSILDKQNNRFENFKTSYSKDSSLSNNVIKCIFEDSKSRIWIGTEGGGLNEFHRDRKTFSVYNTQNGMPSDIVWAIMEDEKGNLWISTSKGLVKFNPETNLMLFLDEKDGFFGSQYSREGFAKAKDGKMYFGGDKGINAFYPKEILKNPFPPKIVLENLYVSRTKINIGQEINGRVILTQQLNFIDKLILTPKEKNLSISFKALIYPSHGNVNYKYRLKGFENEWQYTNEINNIVNYSNLTPGKYIFQVNASNKDGVWNKVQKELIIIVTPPLGLRWWFIALYIISVLLGFYLIYSFRMNALKKQKINLEKIVAIRTQEVMQQKDKLSIQANNLQETNNLLNEQKEEIRSQADNLITANQELKLLNTTKDKFFSILAHDLRNPFQAITLTSQLLKQSHQTMSAANLEEYCSTIYKSSNRASNLLENLLEWARSQTDSVAIMPENVSIKNIVQDVFDLLNTNAQNKKILLTEDIPENIHVYADKNSLTTIIRNLVSNAIKFTHRGSVSISIKEKEKTIEIYIADTGIGMSKTKVNNLFTLMENTSTEGTAGEKGTGLGLIICQEFIKKNKGAISVESVENKGTTFKLELLKSKEYFGSDTTNILNKNSDFPFIRPEIAGAHILLIDDNKSLRESVKSILSEYYKITEAEDGEAAWNWLLKNKIDLVLSDIMMPKMNGLELSAKIKSHPDICHLPIILLTGRTNENIQIEGIQTGADDYITKPFNPNLLLARIDNLLKSRIRLKENFEKDNLIKPKEITVSSMDEALIKKALEIIEKEIANADYSIEDFALEMNVSSKQLYRKLDAITGKTPAEFIRTIRLKRAMYLIENSDFSVSEIAYKVGFKDPSNFTKTFKKQFNKSPKEYISLLR